MRCNLIQLADITGIGVVTLKARLDEGMPFVSRPKNRVGEWVFDTAEVIEYLCGRTEAVEVLSEGKQVKLETEKIELALKTLEYGVKSGQLINIKDAIVPVVEANAIVKSRAMAIPGRLAQTLALESDPAVVQRVIADEINSAFGEMYDSLGTHIRRV